MTARRRPTIVLLRSALLSVFGGLLAQNTQADEPFKLDWVPISGGCFLMGENNAYREEAPIHEACVSDFEITRTEITNAQFSAFVDDTGYKTRAERGWRADEEGGPGITMPPGSAVFAAPQSASIRELDWWRFHPGANWRQPLGEASEHPHSQLPAVHITQADARAFANWAGGRLPTETEWEFAATSGGTEAEAYRPGNKPAPAANTWQGIFPIADTGDDGFKGLAPVARYEPNAFGLYDMIGNAWEWTSTPYTPAHDHQSKLRADAQGHDPAQPGIPVGTIKGGSYLCATSYCYRFRPAARQAQDLAFGTSHIGFRIVREVDP